MSICRLMRRLLKRYAICPDSISPGISRNAKPAQSSAEFSASAESTPHRPWTDCPFLTVNLHIIKAPYTNSFVAKNGSALEFIPVPFVLLPYWLSVPRSEEGKGFAKHFLLEAELQSGSADPYLLFPIRQSYFGLSEYANALPYFE